MSVPSADGKPAAVIRRVQGAGETAHERLVKKHIPAWVVSGAVHAALVGALLLTDVVLAKPAKEAPSEAQLTVVTDEKEQEEKKVDLTNPDIGFDPDIPAAVDAEKLADVNVETKVVTDEPPGVENAASNLKKDFIPPPGLTSADANAGTAGDAGDFMKGGGGGSGSDSDPFGGRGGATKSKLLARGGGNSRSEAAVARGLIWLAKQQRANGAWVYDGQSRADTIAATGMGLLPFLAAGQTHKVSKDHKYNKTVEAGLRYLISQQNPNGSFKGGGMYSHGIATIALCEAYGMSRDKALLFAPAQKAVNFIQQAQGVDGSWGYTPNTTGDTSIVGWQMQALHAAKLCKDLVVDKRTVERAVKFLDGVSSGSNKSRYGYRDAGSFTPTRTAVGLLCRYYESGWGPNNPGYAAGVSYLMKSQMPKPTDLDMYYYYYATQVVHFFEGPEWYRDWNPAMRDMLIDLQTPEGKKDAGSWDPKADVWIGGNCGRLGMTCMSLLTLEVYYRTLATYKRGDGGLKELERVR